MSIKVQILTFMVSDFLSCDMLNVSSLFFNKSECDVKSVKNKNNRFTSGVILNQQSRFITVKMKDLL